MATPEDRKTLVNWGRYNQQYVDDLFHDFVANFKPECIEVARVAFYTLYESSFDGHLKDIAHSLDYTGFNPKDLLEEFKKLADADTEQGEWEIKNEAGNVMIKIKKAGDIKQDLILLSMIFMMRGTVISKILKRIQEQWKPVLEHKFKAYKLNHTRKGPNLKPLDMTLARIASSVPHICVLLLHMGIGKIYINMSETSRAFYFKVPQCALTQMFAGIVPREGLGSTLLDFCFFYAYSFDWLINSKALRKSKETREEYLDRIELYVKAANQSALYSDNFRRIMLREVGILLNRDGTDSYTNMGHRLSIVGKSLWDFVRTRKDHDEVRTQASSFMAQQGQVWIHLPLSDSNKLDIYDGSRYIPPVQQQVPSSWANAFLTTMGSYLGTTLRPPTYTTTQPASVATTTSTGTTPTQTIQRKGVTKKAPAGPTSPGKPKLTKPPKQDTTKKEESDDSVYQEAVAGSKAALYETELMSLINTYVTQPTAATSMTLFSGIKDIIITYELSEQEMDELNKEVILLVSQRVDDKTAERFMSTYTANLDAQFQDE